MFLSSPYDAYDSIQRQSLFIGTNSFHGDRNRPSPGSSSITGSLIETVLVAIPSTSINSAQQYCFLPNEVSPHKIEVLITRAVFYEAHCIYAGYNEPPSLHCYDEQYNSPPLKFYCSLRVIHKKKEKLGIKICLCSGSIVNSFGGFRDYHQIRATGLKD